MTTEPDPQLVLEPGQARLLLGDSFEVLAGFDACSVDAVICDPPYGLEFMGKEWDSFKGGASFSSLNYAPDALPLPSFGRGMKAMTAFQNWCYSWAVEALRVLKPGGFCLAFGGTRTQHRLAVALEDAGFEIRDRVLVLGAIAGPVEVGAELDWLHGQGFPKALDVSRALDALAGEARPDRVVGEYGSNQVFSPTRSPVEKGTPVTAAAAAGGWATALKPAHEPVVVARKPFPGSVADNWLEHGTGALNIAAARAGTSGGVRTIERKRKDYVSGATAFPPHASAVEQLDAGRWPANVAMLHLAECKGSGPAHTGVLCAAGCPVALLNEQSGESSSSLMPLPVAPGDSLGRAHGNTDARTVRGHNDRGGAARFFYVAKPKTRERVAGTIRSLHPTVKPVELMRWLVRLVTPPGGVVLDPFMGSGTTGCAAMVEGVRFVGVERDPEYFDLACARVGDWAFARDRPKPLHN